jgi:predicted dehydrogenase
MSHVREIGVAIVGCGFVADYYMLTLQGYPWIRVHGVFDIDPARLDRFSRFHRLHPYDDLEQLLNDNRIEIVLNLTNPRAHYGVSTRALNAGMHVYSEKPLAMNFEEAEALVKLAESRGLLISSAPCSLLGAAAQTLWRAVRDQVVGPVRLVYAELDDGMLHRMPYKKWVSASGVPWPYKDEFEVGCTLEHAGYYVSWLIAMFGPVTSMTAFSDCLIPDKHTDVTLAPPDTPDFSVGLMKFENGTVARLSVGIVAPHNHGIHIVCEEGMLELDEAWHANAKVYVRRHVTIRRKGFLSPLRRRYRIPNAPESNVTTKGSSRMNYAAGVAELASAVLEGRPCRLSPQFSLHVTEVSLALHNSGPSGTHYRPRSRFMPPRPMDWAAVDNH